MGTSFAHKRCKDVYFLFVHPRRQRNHHIRDEDSIGKLEEQKSYLLKNIVVREFAFRKYFTIIMIQSKTETVHLFAFGNTVQELAQLTTDDKITAEALLSAPPIAELTYNSEKLTSFTRMWIQTKLIHVTQLNLHRQLILLTNSFSNYAYFWNHTAAISITSFLIILISNFINHNSIFLIIVLLHIQLTTTLSQLTCVRSLYLLDVQSVHTTVKVKNFANDLYFVLRPKFRELYFCQLHTLTYRK